MATHEGGMREVRDGRTGRVLVESFSPQFDRVILTPDERFVVVNNLESGPVRVIEHATGRPVARLDRTGHLSGVLAVGFSPDGRHMATGGHDTTILVRDFRELCGRSRKGPLKLDKAALESRWNDLGAADAKAAWAAVADLAACPEAVAFLAARLRPVADKEAAAVREHVKALDDDSFAARRQARKALDALGAEWLTTLHDGLGGDASVEVTRALQVLLRSPKRRAYSAEALRRLRAVAVLEWQATAEARKLLSRLAGGADGMELTLQAKVALARLKR